MSVKTGADSGVDLVNLLHAEKGAAYGVSIWQLLFMTQFFENYKSMYDQIKINGFRCKVIGNSAGTLTLASGLSTVSVVTAVDRNGIPGVPYADTAKVPNEGHYNTPFLNIGDSRAEAYGIESVNKVLTYGSAKSKPWSPGNAFTQYVSCYPQTAAEKQQWISTDRVRRTYYQKVGEAHTPHISLGYPHGISDAGPFSRTGDNYTNTAIDNAAFGTLLPTFDPVLMLGVYNVPEVTHGELSFAFTLEFKIDVSFRGTRAGSVINPGLQQAVGGERLDTLAMTVPFGQTEVMSPAQGYLWNKAIVTSEEPDAVDVVGVDWDGDPETAATLLENTRLVFPDATPASFIADDEGILVLPHTTATPCTGIAVYNKAIKEEHEAYVHTYDKNGEYDVLGTYHGLHITVDVRPVLQVSQIQIPEGQVRYIAEGEYTTVDNQQVSVQAGKVLVCLYHEIENGRWAVSANWNNTQQTYNTVVVHRNTRILILTATGLQVLYIELHDGTGQFICTVDCNPITGTTKPFYFDDGFFDFVTDRP